MLPPFMNLLDVFGIGVLLGMVSMYLFHLWDAAITERNYHTYMRDMQSYTNAVVAELKKLLSEKIDDSVKAGTLHGTKKKDV